MADCKHDWQYSDMSLHKICTRCGAVMRYTNDYATSEVDEKYRVADLPDPMGCNRKIKLWGSE